MSDDQILINVYEILGSGTKRDGIGSINAAVTTPSAHSEVISTRSTLAAATRP